jgi:ketosteroid isomerase-like protein
MAESRAERNVAWIRLGFDAFQTEGLEAVLPFLDDQVEVHAAPGLINAGTYHGHEGYLAWLTAWLEAWEDFEAEPAELEPVGDDHVLVDVRQTARGVGSGVAVEMHVFWAFEIGQERIVRIHLYPEGDQAFAAIEGWRRGEEGG